MAKTIPAIEIETVYRGWVYYRNTAEYDETFYDRVSTFAHKRKDVHVSDWSAGPCWDAYFVIEGTTSGQVKRAAEQIVRYIHRFKGGEIL